VNLALLIALPQPIQEQLLDRFVVGHHDVADGVAADKVTDFLSEIFGMVASTLERLSHEDDLQACLAVHILRIFNVPHENQVAQAVHFRV